MGSLSRAIASLCSGKGRRRRAARAARRRPDRSRLRLDVVESLEQRIALTVNVDVSTQYRTLDWSFQSPAQYSFTPLTLETTAYASLSLQGTSSWTSPTAGTSTVSGSGQGSHAFASWTETYTGAGSGTLGSLTINNGSLSGTIAYTGIGTSQYGSNPYSGVFNFVPLAGGLNTGLFPFQLSVVAQDERVVGGQIQIDASIVTTNDKIGRAHV